MPSRRSGPTSQVYSVPTAIAAFRARRHLHLPKHREEPIMARTNERLNPYARYLTDRDELAVLRDTPERLATLVAGLDRARLTRPAAAGKWSVHDIVCHLADTEIVFAFRLRQTVAESHHVIQPFDQDAWAAPYARLESADALRAFAAVRLWNLGFLGAVLPAAHARPVTHPERGTMTLQDIVETMAGHDLNHTRQVEMLATRPS
jgi:uncharacterized damage-inducible protein DinB